MNNKFHWKALVFTGMAALGAVVCVVMTYRQLTFVRNAEVAKAVVFEVTGRDTRCGGGGRRRRSYACTKFSGNARFLDRNGVERTVSFAAGSSRGNGQPASNATSRVGEEIEALYLADDPTKATRNSWSEVWGNVTIAWLIQFALMFVAYLELRMAPRKLAELARTQPGVNG